MDSSNFPPADDDEDTRPLSRSQLQLQGPRPPPLSIHKDSHKIKKPPKPPADHRSRQQYPQSHPQPIIIYAVSPKKIHVTVAEFMTTVQRLTGVSSDNFRSAGDVSPAARLASVEKVSPKEKGTTSTTTTTTTIIDTAEEGTDFSRIPGILSPAMLPPVIQEMYFSPVPDPNPYNYNFHGSNAFLASPSGLFSGAVGSPTFSPDIFGQIWDF